MGFRIFVLLLLFLSVKAQANSVILDATTKTVELLTSAAVSVDYSVSYVDNTTSTFVPGETAGNVSTATTTTILSAPGASTQRQVKWVSVRNRSAASSQTVTLILDVSGTEYRLTSAVALEGGESLLLTAEGRVIVYLASGIVKGEATYVCNGDGACINNPNYVTTYVISDGGFFAAANFIEVSVSLTGVDGPGFYSTTVTGQTWVTASSKIICTPWGTTADGLTPETVAMAHISGVVTNLVAGTGFDLYVSNDFGLYGTVRFNCTGV